MQGTVNVSVTQLTVGSASFTVNDDTGSLVPGATVTLYGQTNGNTYQAVTGSNGQVAISGVAADTYAYVVAAASHDPGSGTVAVTADFGYPDHRVDRLRRG